mmetsp:Transcript_6702/g.15950  ORF Transcript_6702/g.15950 Transcript_6702/m.15950 type:complete len:440 (-) Transcript_6702:191-1510(-)
MGSALCRAQTPLPVAEECAKCDVEPCYHPILNELAGGQPSYLVDIRCEDLEGRSDSKGNTITGPVARGIVRQLARIVELSAPAGGLDARTQSMDETDSSPLAPPAEEARLEFEVTFAAWERSRRPLKPVTASSPDFHNRTPAQQRQHLESKENTTLREKGGMPRPSADERTTLLNGLRTAHGSAFDPRKTGGLPPVEDGADFAIVSAPVDDSDLYSEVVHQCLVSRIGLAVVFEAHWKELWFAVWKRNVEAMVVANKILLVLTKSDGRISFTQSMEVQHLEERGYKFTHLMTHAFLSTLFPWLYLPDKAKSGEQEHDEYLRVQLASPRGASLVTATDKHGRTALHHCCTAGGVKLLLEAAADINAKAWPCIYAMTPAMHHANLGNARVVQALLNQGADMSLKDGCGRTASKIAAQRHRREPTPGCEEIVQILQAVPHSL